MLRQLLDRVLNEYYTTDDVLEIYDELFSLEGLRYWSEEYADEAYAKLKQRFEEVRGMLEVFVKEMEAAGNTKMP